MAMYPCLSLPSLSFPTVSGAVCSFDSQYAGLPLKSHVVQLTATQSGSDTPSPSNPRAINGYSAIHIGNISDNTNISYFQGLLNGTYGFVDLGSITYSYNSAYGMASIGIKNYVKKPVNTYRTISSMISDEHTVNNFYELTRAGTSGNYFAFYTDGTFCINTTETNPDTFKTSMSGVYLIYALATPTTPSFTSAEFEALCEAFGMNGQYVTIQIGSTIYGGEHDARTGVFVVTHGISDLGSLTWGYTASGNRFTSSGVASVIKPPATDSTVADIIADIFDTKSLTVLRSSADDDLIAVGDSGTISIRCTTYGTDANAFKTAMSGHYIVYELATPQTIQLPPCPIDTLEGVNNIWADTGDTTLQYPKFG